MKRFIAVTTSHYEGGKHYDHKEAFAFNPAHVMQVSADHNPDYSWITFVDGNTMLVKMAFLDLLLALNKLPILDVNTYTE